tara:strand:- start:320 stop:1201 length:882 start_codon:yes stop_codon:yes gene_type:complete
MLKKLRKTVAKILPGDSEKYLGTALALATGNPLFAGIGALADPDAGFGDIAAAAFLASQSPGLKFGGVDLTKGNQLFGDSAFMKALQGGSKFGKGASGFGEFFLGKKAVGDKAAIDGLIGSGGKFLPTKMVDGEEKVDAAKLLSNLSKASAATGAFLKPTGAFDLPEEQEVTDFTFGTDYQGKPLNTEQGKLIELLLGQGIVGPYIDTSGQLVQNVADGGIMNLATGGDPKDFPRKTGQIDGPGTGTSDSIPAMLSDGEFVMTAKAVRGAGGGDRMEGARKMYQMMDQFEGQA